MEEYDGSINVQFDRMPAIKLVSYEQNQGVKILKRLTVATRRREFTLLENWKLALGNVSYRAGLNGTIEIPAEDATAKKIIFDGASIPVPWLISLLTIGILRPLGVTLIGSIVHDYAYKYGKLRVLDKKGNVEEVSLKRHEADKLFRDIIGTINGLPPVGYIAWLAVRIGWLWVPYNGQRHTGKKPITEYFTVFLIMSCFYFIYSCIGFNTMLTGFIGIYIGIYLSSLILQYYYSLNSSK